MKIFLIFMCVCAGFFLIAGPLFAWREVSFIDEVIDLDESSEPHYEITFGSHFGIAVERGDPISEFTRKPDVYITCKTRKRGKRKEKKIHVKILNKDNAYSNGQLSFPCKFVICEWSKKLPVGDYELWILPRNQGFFYEPSRITGDFTLHKPIVTSVTELDLNNPKRCYLQVLGRYFSLAPKIYVKYSVLKGGKIKIHKKRCGVEYHFVDRVTEESEAVYSFVKPKNKKFKLILDNNKPLITVSSNIEMSNSSSCDHIFSHIDVGAASNPTFGDLDGDGDLDLVVGDEYHKSLSYFENTGSTTEPVYIQRKDDKNPCVGIAAGKYLNTPFLADLDGDGDLDLVVGALNMSFGGICYWENIGTSSVPEFKQKKGDENPFKGIGYKNSSSYVRPVLADIDDDGDLDLMYNDIKDAKIFFYRNIGDSISPKFRDETLDSTNPFISVVLHMSSILQPYPAIAFGDIDLDGDLDIVYSEYSGDIFSYENIGTSKDPVFRDDKGVSNPFDNVLAGTYGTPVLEDINGDGCIDLVCGRNPGTLFYAENTFLSLFYEMDSRDSPSGGIDVGVASNPTFGDLDGDGDLDLVVGDEYHKSLSYFENTGSTTEAVYIQRKDDENPCVGIAAGKYLNAPFLADLDGDGDLDLVVGALNMSFGGICYWENIGTSSVPEFKQMKGDKNPFNGIGYKNSNSYARPLLVDIDNDGDLDLMYTESRSHKVFFYQNIGDASVPKFVDATDSAIDPFGGIEFKVSSDVLEAYLSIAFVDADEDGDFDIVSSDYSGKFYYYRNCGSAEKPKFDQPNSDFVDYMDVGCYGTPTVGDFNGDGKPDLLSGDEKGNLHAFLHGSFFYVK